MPTRLRRLSRRAAWALILLAVGCWAAQAAVHASGPHRAAALHPSAAPSVAAGAAPIAAGHPVSARTLAAVTPAASGPCAVPGIGDIGGLLGFCNLGQSGLTGDLNNLCQPSVPTPEPANAGVDAIIRPPGTPGRQLATPYNQYGIAGANWEATNLHCSDMSSLIGNNVAGMIFGVAKSMDRLTITVYQAAAGEGILGWLERAADRLITGLGHAIYFPYLALIVIIGAIWLAWQGLIRKRGSRTVEGTIWMIVACAAAIWLIGRPADFTGLGKGVSDGISAALNAGFAHLPAPAQSGCLQVGRTDPQIQPASYSYASGSTVVDQNANELWTVLVCKPWVDGEFGTTALAAPGGKATPVDTYGRQLLWAQAIAVNEQPTPALISAKQAAYTGIATAIQQHDPAAYPLFQGKQWSTRLQIGIAALLAAMVAGVLVLLVAVTLILLKLAFLLLLVVGPFFLLIGTHPGFGRVVAVRWFEMLVGVLLKQAAVALALSVLLYCYALIMGTSDAVLPWVLKILMISLVTLAVFIYRKPFAHLFSAVGYGVIGSPDRAGTELGRAAAAGAANTSAIAGPAVPGYTAYRLARWVRRNPAQAAGLALGAVTAAKTAATAASTAAAAHNAAGTAANGAASATGPAGGAENAALANGQHVSDAANDVMAPSAGPGSPDGTGAPDSPAAGRPALRARAWAASAGNGSGREAPPLKLPSRPGAGSRLPGSESRGESSGRAAAPAGTPASASVGPAGAAQGAGGRWPTATGLSSQSLTGQAPPLSGVTWAPGAASRRPAASTGPAASSGPAAMRPARPSAAPGGPPPTRQAAVPGEVIGAGPVGGARPTGGPASGGPASPGRPDARPAITGPSGPAGQHPASSGRTWLGGAGDGPGRGSWLGRAGDGNRSGQGPRPGGARSNDQPASGAWPGGPGNGDQRRASWLGGNRRDAANRPGGRSETGNQRDAPSWLGQRPGERQPDPGSRGPLSSSSRGEPDGQQEAVTSWLDSYGRNADPGAPPDLPRPGAEPGSDAEPRGPFWLRPVRRRK